MNHNPPIVSLCHHTHVETGGMDQTELTTYSVESLYPPAVPCCPAPVQTRLASWARTFSLPGQCLVILEMMFRLARFLLERLGACSVPTAMRASQGQRLPLSCSKTIYVWRNFCPWSFRPLSPQGQHPALWEGPARHPEARACEGACRGSVKRAALFVVPILSVTTE